MKALSILSDSTTPSAASTSKIRIRSDKRPLFIGHEVKGRRGNGLGPHMVCLTAPGAGNSCPSDFECVAPGARNPQGQVSLDGGFGCTGQGQPNLHGQTPMSGCSNRFQRYTPLFSVAPGARNFDPDFDRKSPIPLPLQRGNGFDAPKGYISVLGAAHTVLLPVHALPLREFGLPRLIYRFRAPGATELMSWNLDMRLLEGVVSFYTGFLRCPSGGATASQ